MNELLIVPCGKKKIWSKRPELDLVRAQDSFTGSPFIVNKKYALAKKSDWMILSSKYGLLNPDDEISNYEVDINELGDMFVEKLKNQIDIISHYSRLISLCSDKFSIQLERAFGNIFDIEKPCKGLVLGKKMRTISGWTKELLYKNDI